MQPLPNFCKTPVKANYLNVEPRTPPTPQTPPAPPRPLASSPDKVSQLYFEFLYSIEKNLEAADEDAMNELKQRISYFKVFAENQALVEAGETSEYPYDFFNHFDYYFFCAIEAMANHQTSPESAKMRRALAPAVSVRRNLLAEFEAADKQ